MPNELMKEKLWEIEQLQARIEELSKPILCAKCSDHIIAGEQGAICEVCASTQESVITGLQGDIEELEKVAIVWHKYPDEKPDMPIDDEIHLYFAVIGGGAAPTVEMVLLRNGTWYRADMGWYQEDQILYWAYLPQPPKEEDETTNGL